jgi:hypothetical protein
MCTAPEINGLSSDAARKLLMERGLIGEVRSRGGTQTNTVFRQTPEPGERFPCDQPILYDLGTIL